MSALAQVTQELTKIENVMREQIAGIKQAATPDALKFWYGTRQEYEAMEEVRKRLGEMLEGLARITLPEMMDEAATKSITLDLVDHKRRFTVNTKISCSMPDKDGGVKWLRDNGHGGLVQEVVNAGTLSAFAKDMLETHGIELPPAYFKMSTMRFMSAAKA